MSEEISSEEIAELLARESMDEDAISRSDVIDAIGSWYDSGIVSWKDYARDDLYRRIKTLPRVGGEMIPMSVMDDIKAEIQQTLDADWSDGLYQALRIIDRHTSGKGNS